MKPKEKLGLKMVAVAFESKNGIKRIDENGKVFVRKRVSVGKFREEVDLNECERIAYKCYRT